MNCEDPTSVSYKFEVQCRQPNWWPGGPRKEKEKEKGTMVLSQWSNSRNGFGSKCSWHLLGIWLSILWRSYLVDLTVQMQRAVFSLWRRSKSGWLSSSLLCPESNGFMTREHTCPLCRVAFQTRGASSLASLLCWARRCLQKATRCTLTTSSSILTLCSKKTVIGYYHILRQSPAIQHRIETFQVQILI